MRIKLRPTWGLIALILLIVAGSIRVPYVLLSPGPAYDTIGQIDGQEFITISGAQTYPTEGALFMTTVSEYGGPTEGIDVFQAIWGWLDPKQEVAPREMFYDDSVSDEENRLQNAEAFSTSQTYAVGAALKYLNLPVNENVVVASITEGAPALGLLKAGDIVTAVDGVTTKVSKEVAQLVQKKPAGSTVTFSVTRQGSAINIPIVTAARVDDPTTTEDESGIPYVGIGLDMQYVGDFNVDFAQTNIGGPSAGMMFSLAIIDKLTPGAITNGVKIAGTGTIDGDGNVGPIGGISRKLIGAADAGTKLFLAPIENCSEVLGAVPDDLTVVPVATLTQAVKAIEDFNSGKPLPTCSAQ